MDIVGSPTSYFSEPSTHLDPNLFDSRHLKGWARQGIQSLLVGFLSHKYRHPELWSHAWLAGSGVSYQWEAARTPGDLDCLFGIDYIQFRKANPEFIGLSDREIAEQINDEIHEDLHPQTENWNGYELTFFALQTDDIRAIHPYAAYDVKYDEWTVSPNPMERAPYKPEWEDIVSNDRTMAAQVITRFQAAMTDTSIAYNDALRRNAEARLEAASQQGSALYDEIHGNRALAFSDTGEGYSDFNNYRWQAGKREGTVQALRQIRQHVDTVKTQREKSLYGASLPDAHLALRTSALYGRS
jgi:hypothetical protein